MHAIRDGYGNGSFQAQKKYSIGNMPSFVAVRDFNNDGRLDIVVANYLNDDVSVLLGYGNGSFENQTTYSTSSYPVSVTVSDFILDIIVASYGSNNVVVLRGYHDGTFANMVIIQLEYGSRPFSVLVSDFNNDRKLDFAVANNGTDSSYNFSYKLINLVSYIFIFFCLIFI